MVYEDDLPVYSEIVKVEEKYNYQKGEGYYKQVTYADGNFRQFDCDTSELIGSSYAVDQQYLPNIQ